MRGFTLLLLFIYLYLEISLFVMVANSIGVFLALMAIFATSLLGFSLVKSQGIKNIQQMRQKLQQGQAPFTEMMINSSLFLAGGLLLLPGFLTDIIGAILLLPPVQNAIVKRLLAKQSFTQPNMHADANDVIEGQFSRKDD